MTRWLVPGDGGRGGLEWFAQKRAVRGKKEKGLIGGLVTAQAIAANEGGAEVDFDAHEAVSPRWRQAEAMAEDVEGGGIVATPQIDDEAGG